jgi:3-deoxy-7-phosphoheptulonate synthase
MSSTSAKPPISSGRREKRPELPTANRAKSRKPVLKRGMSERIEEWLLAAEYILMNGNPNVLLCERGIRTFETYTQC